MKEDAWYKQFGGNPIARFYHITEIYKDNSLSTTVYEFHWVLKKVVSQESRVFDSKQWMQREINNDVHEVPRSEVPFLMPF